ncbi:lysozyme P-like [Condylostylus longicornis]|uniref:lysozyme P-like n=1 Tax=Condylostylus longicornis TaxID=2530218 RepID=UPI00244DDBCA|nr:lysozyme P-like [Condylostylus longicornis]
MKGKPFVITISFLIFLITINNQIEISDGKITTKRGKVFDMCGLAKELHRLGVPSMEIPDWICIALHESAYNTRAKKVNRDKSTSWGLFQINDKRWCEPPDIEYGVKKDYLDICGIECTKLITDDITASVECARHIKESNKKGFANWALWRNKCQYHKPDVKICF